LGIMRDYEVTWRDMNFLRAVPEGVVLQVRVQPRASREGIEGCSEDCLRLRVTAPPVGGQANEACVELVARALGVKRGLVDIRSGHRSRTKGVLIRGMTLAQAEEALRRLGPI
jgi:uncharacterized protein (TIGR00251 family)